jgi:glycosyltransferase involved in cell wall biosynthesis
MFGKFGVPSRRIRTILPFVVKAPDLSLAMPERLAGFVAVHGPVLLTVGLLEPEYDLGLQIDVLGEVRKQHPNAGLIIAGSGSLEHELRNKIDACGWRDHILLYGDMPHPVTMRATLECDALLRTTLYDGDSVSVREALYLGTPVIATDNGMRPDGVRLIPAKNRERLVAEILDTLSEGRSGRAPAGDGQENIRAVLQFYREL